MLLAVLAALAAAGPAPFTLDQVMSAPFPTDLVAAPGHPRVAWVMNARGPQRLGGRGTRLRRPGRHHLHRGRRRRDHRPRLHRRCPARGLRARGRTEPRGRDPEPAEPDGAARACRPRGAPGRSLATPGRGPLRRCRTPARTASSSSTRTRLSPSNWPRVRKPERLFGARGGLGSLRFSADGALLAFVSDRGDHAFVGVYDVAAKTIRWMDPGVDRDGEPAFSPDGKSLAFLRLPAQKDRFVFGAEREGEPWSIRVAEVASGRSREVFRADKGPGSVFAEVTPATRSSGERATGSSSPGRRAGWRHLYSVPAEGGPPIALTAGEFEVEHVSPGPTEPRWSTARTRTTSIGGTSGRCRWPEALRRPSPPAPASSGRR